MVGGLHAADGAVVRALLPDGKVLLWSANRAFSFWEGELQVHTAIYNPVTNTHTYRVQGIPHNMFCTGTTQMPDGSDPGQRRYADERNEHLGSRSRRMDRRSGHERSARLTTPTPSCRTALS